VEAQREVLYTFLLSFLHTFHYFIYVFYHVEYIAVNFTRRRICRCVVALPHPMGMHNNNYQRRSNAGSGAFGARSFYYEELPHPTSLDATHTPYGYRSFDNGVAAFTSDPNYTDSVVEQYNVNLNAYNNGMANPYVFHE
jgi:hypothetical protein